MVENNGDTVPDVEAIMSRIRAQVKSELAVSDGKLPRYTPPAARLFDGSSSPILYSDELNYLNAHWNDWSLPEEISSHRPFIGPLIVRLKKAVRNALWNSFFKGYFSREREFQMQLVRFLNATARYIDSRDAELFWQIIGKVDNDIVLVNERSDGLYDQLSSSVQALETSIQSRIEATEELLNRCAVQYREQQQRLIALQDAVGQLRKIVVGAGTGGLAGSEADVSEQVADRSEILQIPLGADSVRVRRLKNVLPHLSAAGGNVIEVSGDLSRLAWILTDRTLPSTAETFEDIEAKGGVLAYLEQLAKCSLGGLVVTDIREKNCPIERQDLLCLSRQKVKPGGRVIIELVFDDTWRQDSAELELGEEIKELIASCGLSYIGSFSGQPASSEQKLVLLETADYLPARWQQTILQINRNTTKINELLFGPKSLFVIAEVPPKHGSDKA